MQRNMRFGDHKSANQIDHIAIVVDASTSMDHLTKDVVRVVDNQVAYLAKRSVELNREVRVSVYFFGSKDDIVCAIFDMDALRLPSIAGLYKPYGWTALIDATLKSQEDLRTTSVIYGDHAFLTYVITDGAENDSRRGGSSLKDMLTSKPSNYTVGVLVPNHEARHKAARWGFPEDNIEIWDATSASGLDAASSRITTATENFFQGRQRGERGTNKLFSTGPEAVNAQTVTEKVKVGDLEPLPINKYSLVPVPVVGAEIRPFVQEAGLPYKPGCAFYQLKNTVTIQGTKEIAVVDKKTDKVYVGKGARDLVGLSDQTERRKANKNDQFDIFVQSKSVNRKLIVGTRLLVMT